MTEAEWQNCEDPRKMLEWLLHSEKASDRKLRLFACACGRRVWQLLKESDSRAAIEVAESYADGLERKATAEGETFFLLSQTITEQNAARWRQNLFPR